MNAYREYANEYRWWENVEAVTLRGSQTREIAYAKRDDTKRGRVPAASETVLGDSVDWHIPDALLDGVELQIGDRLYVGMEADIDSTTELWLVRETMRVRFGTEWVAKSMRFGATMLRHTVDIKGPTIAKDSDTGAASETFAVIRSGVPCWVRPATADESVAWFQESSIAGFLVHFDHDPAVDTPHVLIFGERPLAVQGYARNVDGLNVLWIVPCIG